MTRYAIDTERRTLIASWGTGIGDIATTVTSLPDGADVDLAYRVASSLTDLSSQLWNTYTHPSTGADRFEDNSEGSRPDEERGAFARVLDILRAPNLPEHGMLLQSYIAVEESAHRTGRALHDLSDSSFVDGIASDVADEMDAITRAELGDLAGRARQAVLLDRADASPVQIAAANMLFEASPFGDERLFTEFDPTAAAVAAAYWLAAAADVVADTLGVDPTDVIIEADNIEALPIETPTTVLQRIADGTSPHEVVSSLMREAMAAASGELPNVDAVLAQIAEAEARAAQLGDRTYADPDTSPIRTTPLDPKRPARDLLEDLLAGIQGCWLLWEESGDAAQDGDDAENVDDDAADDTYQKRRTDSFLNALRKQAALDADRLE